MVQHNDAEDDPKITIEIDCFDILLNAFIVAVGMVILTFAINSVSWLHTIVFKGRDANYGAIFSLCFLTIALTQYLAEWNVIQEIKKQHGRGK